LHAIIEHGADHHHPDRSRHAKTVDAVVDRFIEDGSPFGGVQLALPGVFGLESTALARREDIDMSSNIGLSPCSRCEAKRLEQFSARTGHTSSRLPTWSPSVRVSSIP